MVGIFQYELGLKFVAVSESKEKAVSYLFNKHASDYDKSHLTPMEWWERNRENNNGVPRCYEIKEIKIWA